MEFTTPSFVPSSLPGQRSIVQLERLLSRISYKRGWDIRAGRYSMFDARDATGYLLLTLNAVDTYHPERTIPVAMSFAVYEVPLSDSRMLDWVRDCIRWLEGHEIDEWLAVDGKRPYNPHRDGYTMPRPPEMRDYATAGYRYGMW